MSTSPRSVPPQPLQKSYEDSRKIREEFENIYRLFQPKLARIVAAAPNTSQIGEGEIVLFDDAVNRRIYTKINGSIRFVALT